MNRYIATILITIGAALVLLLSCIFTDGINTAMVVVCGIIILFGIISAVTQWLDDRSFKSLKSRLGDRYSDESVDLHRKAIDYSASHDFTVKKGKTMEEDFIRRLRNPRGAAIGILAAIILLIMTFLPDKPEINERFICAVSAACCIVYVVMTLTVPRARSFIKRLRESSASFSEINDDYMESKVYSKRSALVSVGNSYVTMSDGARFYIFNVENIKEAGIQISQIHNKPGKVFTTGRRDYALVIKTDRPYITNGIAFNEASIVIDKYIAVLAAEEIENAISRRSYPA